MIPGFMAAYQWSHASAHLSPEAKKRLAWFDYFRKTKNVARTCRYFGISRKTFYFWRKRYDAHKLVSLESHSPEPRRKRVRMTTPEQETRIVLLRRQHIRYGKEKLARIYASTYGEPMTAWKVQKVIEKYKIYYRPAKNARTQAKRRKAEKRKRITQLRKNRCPGSSSASTPS